MPVERIHQSDIKDTLSPIWHAKADVARKALNRLNIVLRYAAAKGLDVDLQATTKAKELLGRSRHHLSVSRRCFESVSHDACSFNAGQV